MVPLHLSNVPIAHQHLFSDVLRLLGASRMGGTWRVRWWVFPLSHIPSVTIVVLFMLTLCRTGCSLSIRWVRCSYAVDVLCYRRAFCFFMDLCFDYFCCFWSVKHVNILVFCGDVAISWWLTQRFMTLSGKLTSALLVRFSLSTDKISGGVILVGIFFELSPLREFPKPRSRILASAISINSVHEAASSLR